MEHRRRLTKMPWSEGFVPHNAAHADRSFKDKAILEDLYLHQGMTGTDIAALAGIDRHTVVRWLRQFGIPVRTGKEARQVAGYQRRMSGRNHPNFKDGKRAMHTGWGYRLVTLYGEERQGHRCDKQGRIPEHSYVMECHIGRSLKPAEVVHHQDFNRLSNDIGNLVLFPTQAAHAEYHKHLERVGAYHLGLIAKLPQYDYPDGTIVGTQS